MNLQACPTSVFTILPFTPGTRNYMESAVQYISPKIRSVRHRIIQFIRLEPLYTWWNRQWTPSSNNSLNLGLPNAAKYARTAYSNFPSGVKSGLTLSRRLAQAYKRFECDPEGSQSPFHMQTTADGFQEMITSLLCRVLRQQKVQKLARLETLGTTFLSKPQVSDQIPSLAFDCSITPCLQEFRIRVKIFKHS